MTHQHASAALPEPEGPSVPVLMAEVYNTDRFGQLYAASRSPPVTNLGLAACFLCALFQYHGIPFSFLGGWAVYLRGSGRVTNDVDVTVDASMALLEAALSLEQRVCIPQQHGQTSIQIFIHTGGDWDPDRPNTAAFTVSADVIIKGHLGTPTDLRYGYGTELFQPSVCTPHESSLVPILSLFYQLSAKLQAHSFRRNVTRNDYADLMFLIERYQDEVWSYRDLLDRAHLTVFWNDVSHILGYSHETTIHIGCLLGLIIQDEDQNMVQVGQVG